MKTIYTEGNKIFEMFGDTMADIHNIYEYIVVIDEVTKNLNNPIAVVEIDDNTPLMWTLSGTVIETGGAKYDNEVIEIARRFESYLDGHDVVERLPVYTTRVEYIPGGRLNIRYYVKYFDVMVTL